MAQHQQATAVGTNHVTLNAVEGAMNAIDATSKHFQAVANEMFEMSKQSMEQVTQALDKLRSTRVMDEVMSIQSDYVKQAFAYFTQHSRRFGELFMLLPRRNHQVISRREAPSGECRRAGNAGGEPNRRRQCQELFRRGAEIVERFRKS